MYIRTYVYIHTHTHTHTPVMEPGHIYSKVRTLVYRHTHTHTSCLYTRRRGPGWRIHGSVEDTKLSSNKQHSLSRVHTHTHTHAHTHTLPHLRNLTCAHLLKSQCPSIHTLSHTHVCMCTYTVGVLLVRAERSLPQLFGP